MRLLTFTPIDLGASIGGGGLPENAAAILLNDGWSPRDGMWWDKGNLALGFVRTGFAILIFSWHAGDDDIPEYCRIRGQYHHGLMTGERLPTGFSDMIRRLRDDLRKNHPKERRRILRSTIIHYAFTMAILEHDPAPRDRYAILDPSLIGFDDRGNGELDVNTYDDANFGTNLAITKVSENPNGKAFALRVDLPSEGYAMASWATLLLVGTFSQQTLDKVIAMEADVQLSWLAAWLGQSIGEEILDLPAHKVRADVVRWQCLEFSGLKYWTKRRQDPSERQIDLDLRRMLEITSQLDHEWDMADAAMERAQSLTELIESSSHSRQSAMLDALMLVLSLTSLAQVLYVMPIDNWETFFSSPPQAISLTLFLTIGLILVIRLHRR